MFFATKWQVNSGKKKFPGQTDRPHVAALMLAGHYALTLRLRCPPGSVDVVVVALPGTAELYPGRCIMRRLSFPFSGSSVAFASRLSPGENCPRASIIVLFFFLLQCPCLAGKRRTSLLRPVCYACSSCCFYCNFKLIILVFHYPFSNDRCSVYFYCRILCARRN